MINMRLKRYQKDFEHSYALGVFATLELLQHRPEDALGITLHPKGMRNEGVEKIHALAGKHDIKVEINEKAINRISPRGGIYAVGVLRKTSTSLNRERNHVILVNPSDMGNLGTIMRTMLGFNYQDLAIIQPAADHYDPRTIRASMGAIFQTNIAVFDDFEAYQDVHQHQLYPLMTGGEVPLPEVDFQAPFGLVFGSESSGLPEAFEEVGRSISIPQSEKIDSFNLALSVGITLYQASLG
ncbi:MAG: TrmH family RNA methyltransferase [Chloroflexota bacterium]